MRARSLAAGRSPLLIAAALAALAPGLPLAAEPAEECVKLVARQVKVSNESKALELQREVLADRITTQMIDALGQKLQLGPSWKAGNPHWQEAYALFRPDLFAGMLAGGEREMRRMEAKLPALLDAAMCRKALALLDTKTGAAAARMEDGQEAGRFLDTFEKKFGVPANLKALADAARREVAQATAAKDDPALQRGEPKLADAREQWRGLGKQYAAGLKRLGDADPEVERKASQEAGAKMMKKNQEAFTDIVRRFKGAAKT